MNPTSISNYLSAENRIKTGHWIVGSLIRNSFSTSNNPETHKSELEARIEAQRLATQEPTKKFVVLEVKGIVSISQHVWE